MLTGLNDDVLRTAALFCSVSLVHKSVESARQCPWSPDGLLEVFYILCYTC